MKGMEAMDAQTIEQIPAEIRLAELAAVVIATANALAKEGLVGTAKLLRDAAAAATREGGK